MKRAQRRAWRDDMRWRKTHRTSPTRHTQGGPMTTTTTTIPALAMASACLVHISRHLDGIYCAHVFEREVMLQGDAPEAEAVAKALNLTRNPDRDHAVVGSRYESWTGNGPDEFATISVQVTAVHSVEP